MYNSQTSACFIVCLVVNVNDIVYIGLWECNNDKIMRKFTRGIPVAVFKK